MHKYHQSVSRKMSHIFEINIPCQWSYLFLILEYKNCNLLVLKHRWEICTAFLWAVLARILHFLGLSPKSWVLCFDGWVIISISIISLQWSMKNTPFHVLNFYGYLPTYKRVNVRKKVYDVIVENYFLILRRTLYCVSFFFFFFKSTIFSIMISSLLINITAG